MNRNRFKTLTIHYESKQNNFKTLIFKDAKTIRI